ncbi:MAG TPA: DUF2064 domain-containing protein [Rhodanobacteraceae bacterium]|nr:DUF2064 domain-containing protein [Rhodanobacteraceae bacterium]
MNAALAIFTKTFGLSPVKTRLAATLGAPLAAEFHRLTAAAIEAVARAAGPRLELAVHWAVAERDALDAPCWSGFPRLWQGEGELGARLDRIYSTLQPRHGRVLMIGVDSPQITVNLLEEALARLDDHATPFALGPAVDGGFWLIAGRIPVATNRWQTVHYSSRRTAGELIAQLAPLGNVARLPTLVDVDTSDDLILMCTALASLPDPLPEQTALLRWVDRMS